MALSFASDIRPLFRDTPDVDTMKRMGLDLSSYADVKDQAAAIHARLEDAEVVGRGLAGIVSTHRAELEGATSHNLLLRIVNGTSQTCVVAL